MKVKNRFWVYNAIKGVPEGCRHGTAVQLVGRWYKRCLTTNEVAILLVAWNELNSPPLSRDEIKSIYNSTRKWRIPWPGEGL